MKNAKGEKLAITASFISDRYFISNTSFSSLFLLEIFVEVQPHI